ncbi:hypothetical protein CDAR_544691 [Caerostris darwini]|uniref:Uncharacterized protein n=1 Tax=Caerostris darwini TaxID=1538125 RepID=A0AAV4TS99_9ARAC|nr:hypothetical protein CDAR_544691 [Caerostris darwini]
MIQVLCMKVAKSKIKHPPQIPPPEEEVAVVFFGHFVKSPQPPTERFCTPKRAHPTSPPAYQTVFLRAKDSTGVLLGTAEMPSRSSLGEEFLALNLEKVDSYSHQPPQRGHSLTSLRLFQILFLLVVFPDA